MKKYTAFEEVTVQYELGKDILTAKGNVLISQGPLKDFIVLDTGEEQSLCISWTNVVILTTKIPEIFLGKMKDVVEHREMSEMAEEMSKADFLNEIAMNKDRPINAFQ